MVTSRRQFLARGAAAAGAAAVARTTRDVSAQARKPSADNHNWGRWGPDDQKGAVNLITPAKRVEAAGLVKSGRTVSTGSPANPIAMF